MSRSWNAKDVILGTIFAAVAVGVLAYAGFRAVDVYYKAGWIVTHFPPKDNLCSEPFCVSTDTKKPGRRFLELHFAYCDRHYSGGFQGRGGRSTPMAVLVGLLVLLFAFLGVPIMGALFRIAALPVLLPLCSVRKIPWNRLVPFSPYWAGADSVRGDWLEPAGMWTGAVLAVAALGLYCWW